PPSYISTLSLHDALPICETRQSRQRQVDLRGGSPGPVIVRPPTQDRSDVDGIDEASKRRPGIEARNDASPTYLLAGRKDNPVGRSEEHTSELQSLAYLVC